MTRLPRGRVSCTWSGIAHERLLSIESPCRDGGSALAGEGLGVGATGFTGDYAEADAALVAGMHHRVQPVDAAVDMLRRHLGDPDPEPLTAYMQHTKIDVGGAPFDLAAARRLANVTQTMLSQH